MKIKYTENSNFQPTPEYNGIAKIVDSTELAEYTGQYGTKEQFRFILEIDEQREDGKYWTVATKPYTPSYHEKASLRMFTEKVLGRRLTNQELEEGFDTEDLIGKYCSIIVEHVVNGEKTFANITFVGKAKSNETWNSDYIRLANREKKTVPVESPTLAQPTKKKLFSKVKGYTDKELADSYEKAFVDK